ncbi:hypothetical protein SBA6_130006 [Candidatus Sulfopaludibacter sp. SbA6]|nr:hypothetical protein SBA6_130006 [Candidatus Sulfopaludibacter sp. SbA6]
MRRSANQSNEQRTRFEISPAIGVVEGIVGGTSTPDSYHRRLWQPRRHSALLPASAPLE